MWGTLPDNDIFLHQRLVLSIHFCLGQLGRSSLDLMGLASLHDRGGAFITHGLFAPPAGWRAALNLLKGTRWSLIAPNDDVVHLAKPS